MSTPPRMPPGWMTVEERLARIEALLACMRIGGDNLPTFDADPRTAREILAELDREIRGKPAA
jgi:hypothetical protein